MTEEVQQEPSVSGGGTVEDQGEIRNYPIFSQATEKIIVSSSKLLNKLENLELLKGPAPPTTQFSAEFTNEPRPAYEIFGNLEQIILYADDDDDFFMPVVDGMVTLNTDDMSSLPTITHIPFTSFRHFSSCDRLSISLILHQNNFSWIKIDESF